MKALLSYFRRLAGNTDTSASTVVRWRAVKIRKPPKGWFAYRYYVLSDGLLAALWTDRDINAERDVLLPPAQNNACARLVVISEEGESDPVDIPLVPDPKIDRFADGCWLIASGNPPANLSSGVILTEHGQPCGSISLGDGIAHVRCSADDTIWARYFDQGVFGDSIGRGGIVHFNRTGQPIWSYNQEGRSSTVLVDDCYALTLNGDELWSCFYSSFSIVRLKDGTEALWTNSVAGAEALAVDEPFIVLAGGYGSDASRLALLKLEGREARLVGSYKHPALDKAALISGQSSVIHMVKDLTWTRISVAEVRSALD